MDVVAGEKAALLSRVREVEQMKEQLQHKTRVTARAKVGQTRADRILSYVVEK